MSHVCELCGGNAHEIEEVREVKIGKRAAEVAQVAMTCDACGEIYVTPEQYESNRLVAVRKMREGEGLLLPEEISALREELGLTQEGLEQLLGVGPKTVVRWENGSVFQNSATDTLLRLLVQHPSLAESLRKLRERVAQAHLDVRLEMQATFRTFHRVVQSSVQAAELIEAGGPRAWTGRNTAYSGTEHLDQAEMFMNEERPEYSAVA